ncbi:MAG TPA: alpha/beta fold hydrolase, partial [Candidatus Deferrimicrobium sp.]|nr:alpha/beta fold hydrolase [Candidatus Deferrimicrobium sp.]
AAGLLVAWAALRSASPRVLARLFRIPHVPTGVTPAEVGLEAEDVTIIGPRGRQLRAWFVAASAAGRQPAALVLHGWTGSASLMLPLARPLLAAGLHVLMLDARCHGRSDDDAFSSMPDFAADAERALAWLRTHPRVDPERIALVGHSVGAGACLMVADRDPRIAAVVSISSMADPAEFMGEAMRRHAVPGFIVWFALHEIQRALGQRFTDFAPLVTIARLRVPVLLIHGDADPVVPLADAEALRAVAPAGTDLLVIPGADHSAVDRFLTVAPAVTAFLQRALQHTSDVVGSS